nr:hypothetical protein [Tanacetum cinerariifolium]
MKEVKRRIKISMRSAPIWASVCLAQYLSAKIIVIRNPWAPSTSAAAGAREATGEGLAGEIHGNSENHSGNAGVPTDDGRV